LERTEAERRGQLVSTRCRELEDQVRIADLTGAAETLRRLDEAFAQACVHLQVLAAGENGS
jgi:hypothetical protein